MDIDIECPQVQLEFDRDYSILDILELFFTNEMFGEIVTYIIIVSPSKPKKNHSKG